jgi:hypothetical protein
LIEGVPFILLGFLQHRSLVFDDLLLLLNEGHLLISVLVMFQFDHSVIDLQLPVVEFLLLPHYGLLEFFNLHLQQTVLGPFVFHDFLATFVGQFG